MGKQQHKKKKPNFIQLTPTRSSDEDEPLKATPAAAEFCGSRPATLEKWRWTGDGPPFLKVGRKVLYRPADLRAFLKGCERRSTSDKGATS
jgi:hypothetical protein